MDKDRLVDKHDFDNVARKVEGNKAKCEKLDEDVKQMFSEMKMFKKMVPDMKIEMEQSMKIHGDFVEDLCEKMKANNQSLDRKVEQLYGQQLNRVQNMEKMICEKLDEHKEKMFKFDAELGRLLSKVEDKLDSKEVDQIKSQIDQLRSNLDFLKDVFNK